ncbi:MAG TPA: TraR/DksA family transcriptional regulator [Anaeromyxobacteraceae bacterium]|nr:TraR/DksA family transcriptional regulator [Anaeromyxobacteraceae bacterium]
MICRNLVEAQRPDPSASWRDWESTPSPLSESERRELDDIEHALRRIEAGHYGMCLSCGGPLGMQRLRAIPEARYCLTCSGQRETV